MTVNENKTGRAHNGHTDHSLSVLIPADTGLPMYALSSLEKYFRQVCLWDQPLTPGAHQPNPASMTIILESAVTATEHRCEALTISDIPPYRCTTSAAAARCEATTTVKGKSVRCDQPAATDRGGHAVCPKHDRAVWIEYVKETTSAPGAH
jgi:hypothetical protein